MSQYDVKSAMSRTDRIPMMESFYTIQGEGYHAGKAAYFIRLAGCDVGCSWCDVKESWDTSSHGDFTVNEILAPIDDVPAKIAVVTGGEPLMHDLTDLTAGLKSMGFSTHIETSGAHNFSGEWDWICLSPKKFKQPVSEAYQLADELKIIIYNQHDFEWAESMAANVRTDCKLFLQPEWSKSQKLMPEIISYVKNNPRWEISLQVHKFMDIP